MVLDFCGNLPRVAASRTMQGKCKVNAVWQARLANAEPQPSLKLASSWLRVQSYNNFRNHTSFSRFYPDFISNVKLSMAGFLYLVDSQRDTFLPFPPCLLSFTRMPPLFHADALRYIGEGIRAAHTDYPHQPRQIFWSTMQTISIRDFYTQHMLQAYHVPRTISVFPYSIPSTLTYHLLYI